MESFPPELERAFPLKMENLQGYCDRLAPHYEAVGHIVGADTTVSWLRAWNNDLPTKMLRILEEWISSGKATWATFVLGLERYIPHLRGLASEICKDLGETPEKGECVYHSVYWQSHNAQQRSASQCDHYTFDHLTLIQCKLLKVRGTGYP